MGENHFAELPVAVYGLSLLMPAIAYYILQRCIVAANGDDRTLAQALGRDVKGKLSPLLRLAGIGLAFANPLYACAVYTLIALVWLVPDPRIERAIKAE